MLRWIAESPRPLRRNATSSVLVTPLGPLAAGFLIESVSPRAAIALFLGVVLVAAVSGTLSRSTREVPGPGDVSEAAAEAAR